MTELASPGYQSRCIGTIELQDGESESRGACYERLSNYLDLVQECHVAHRAAMGFRVHDVLRTGN
jgi:hypothetical protein